MQDRLKLAEATEEGPLRRMFSLCNEGARVNALRDVVTRYPDEDIPGYLERLERKLAFAGAIGTRCLEETSCSGCPRGINILSRGAASTYGCQVEHARAALDLLGMTGSGRILPNACTVGKNVNRIVADCDAGEARVAAVAALTASYGCTGLTSCLHCPLGRGVLDDLLVQLAEDGLTSDAGRDIQGSYSMLW